MSERKPPPRSSRDQHADLLAASACDVLRGLLPADLAAELEAVVADQLALHPELAPIAGRAVPRSERAESGDEVLLDDELQAGEVPSANSLAVGVARLDGGKPRR